MQEEYRQPLWSWPAAGQQTASPLKRLALKPVTLHGPEIAGQGPLPHTLWAESIDKERSALHTIAFSKDLSPRAADGAPLAMHQRLAIEASRATGRAVPGGEYVPAGRSPGTSPITTIPAEPDGERLIGAHRVTNAELCPDPRGIEIYAAEIMLARCTKILESNADPRIPDLDARIRALNTLNEHSGVEVTLHDRDTPRTTSDGHSVAIPDPGRLPLDQTMHGIHAATIGLTRQVANDAGGREIDHNLEMLAAAWTAGHTTQAAAAGLHTLRDHTALSAAAATIRNDAGAYHRTVELAAATEERLLAPARHSSGPQARQPGS